ncbi:hypothetical protein QQ045_003806 [Rhodiola kirilowii]
MSDSAANHRCEIGEVIHPERSARYYSPEWRTWAAVAIQLAWRRYRHRLTPSSLEEDRLKLYTALLTSPKPIHDDFDSAANHCCEIGEVIHPKTISVFEDFAKSEERRNDLEKASRDVTGNNGGNNHHCEVADEVKTAEPKTSTERSWESVHKESKNAQDMEEADIRDSNGFSLHNIRDGNNIGDNHHWKFGDEGKMVESKTSSERSWESVHEEYAQDTEEQSEADITISIESEDNNGFGLGIEEESESTIKENPKRRKKDRKCLHNSSKIGYVRGNPNGLPRKG